MNDDEPKLLFESVGAARQSHLDWTKAVKVDQTREDKVVDWLRQLGYHIHLRPLRWVDRELVVCGAHMIEYLVSGDYVAIKYACFRKHGYTVYGGVKAPLVPLRGLFDDLTAPVSLDAPETFWGLMPFIGFPRKSRRRVSNKSRMKS